MRLARRSLSACPQFLVDFAFFGGMTVWDDGCVLWSAGGGGVGGTGGHGKNDSITLSITNAGAKRPTL